MAAHTLDLGLYVSISDSVRLNVSRAERTHAPRSSCGWLPLHTQTHSSFDIVEDAAILCDLFITYPVCFLEQSTSRPSTSVRVGPLSTFRSKLNNSVSLPSPPASLHQLCFQRMGANLIRHHESSKCDAEGTVSLCEADRMGGVVTEAVWLNPNRGVGGLETQDPGGGVTPFSVCVNAHNSIVHTATGGRRAG